MCFLKTTQSTHTHLCILKKKYSHAREAVFACFYFVCECVRRGRINWHFWQRWRAYVKTTTICWRNLCLPMRSCISSRPCLALHQETSNENKTLQWNTQEETDQLTGLSQRRWTLENHHGAIWSHCVWMDVLVFQLHTWKISLLFQLILY